MAGFICKFEGMKTFVLLISAIILGFSFRKPEKTGTVRIVFNNTISSIPLLLDTVIYKNAFGEPFSVTKFKYYISNVALEKNSNTQKEIESYHLINARDSNSLGFTFPVEGGEYNALSFLIGVDSLRNCSGAQTGALDPMNDMFWTWNSGYVMAKLEGRSDSSKMMKRMEYHIGGYKGGESVLQKISLHPKKPIIIENGKQTVIIIETDLAKWWQMIDKVSISENPVCTTPGVLAKRIAANYANMFAIQQVKN